MCFVRIEEDDDHMAANFEDDGLKERKEKHRKMKKMRDKKLRKFQRDQKKRMANHNKEIRERSKRQDDTSQNELNTRSDSKQSSNLPNNNKLKKKKKMMKKKGKDNKPLIDQAVMLSKNSEPKSLPTSSTSPPHPINQNKRSDKKKKKKRIARKKRKKRSKKKKKKTQIKPVIIDHAYFNLEEEKEKLSQPYDVPWVDLTTSWYENLPKFEDRHVCKYCNEIFLSKSINAPRQSVRLRSLQDICERCSKETENALKNGVDPSIDPISYLKFSDHNNMDPGHCPPELTGLTLIESQLIAQVIPFMTVVKVTGEGGGRFSGSVLCFENDVDFTQILPRSLDSTGIIFLGFNHFVSHQPQFVNHFYFDNES